MVVVQFEIWEMSDMVKVPEDWEAAQISKAA